MNIPPEEYIIVREERLLAFIASCFSKAGLDADHAALISRLLVNNDLRGVRSHASRTAHGYCMGCVNGSYNTKPDVRVVRETASLAVLDGDGTLGYMPMVRAAERAVTLARETGVGVVLVRHIGHYGSSGHYTRICAAQGCIGYSVQGYRNEANASGRDPKPSAAFSGNPPVSFAIPGGEEMDMVLDGGASVVDPYHGPGYEDLPERIPASVFKGMGFIAISTLVGGALTGFTLPEADAIAARWPGAQHGGMVLAIDIGSALAEEVFRAEVDRYTRDLRQTHEPVPGTDRVLLPGHIEEERMELHRRQGIRFGEQEQGAMRSLHEQFGAALPWD